MVSDFPIVLDAMHFGPQWMIDTVASLSILQHFQSISRGVLAVRDVIFFLLMIGVWLVATATLLEIKKAE